MVLNRSSRDHPRLGGGMCQLPPRALRPPQTTAGCSSHLRICSYPWNILYLSSLGGCQRMPGHLMAMSGSRGRPPRHSRAGQKSLSSAVQLRALQQPQSSRHTSSTSKDPLQCIKHLFCRRLSVRNRDPIPSTSKELLSRHMCQLQHIRAIKRLFCRPNRAWDPIFSTSTERPNRHIRQRQHMRATGSPPSSPLLTPGIQVSLRAAMQCQLRPQLRLAVAQRMAHSLRIGCTSKDRQPRSMRPPRW